MDGSTVVFSCYTSLRAIEVAPTAGIRILWSVTSYAAGPPIIAGGVVWDVSRAGLLSGFRLSDGKVGVLHHDRPRGHRLPELVRLRLAPDRA